MEKYENGKGNRKVGKYVSTIFAMIVVSAIAMPWAWNIFYFVSMLTIPFFGEIGSVVFWTAAFIWSLNYYFEVRLIKMQKFRGKEIWIFIISAILLWASIALPLAAHEFSASGGHAFANYVKLPDYIKAGGGTRWVESWQNWGAGTKYFIWNGGANTFGVILSFVLWLFGGWWTQWLPVTIASIGLAFGFWTGVLGKSISKSQKVEEATREIVIKHGLQDIDLNAPTEEFNVQIGEAKAQDPGAPREITPTERAAQIVRDKRQDTSKHSEIINSEKSRLQKIKEEILAKKAKENDSSVTYSEEGFIVNERKDYLEKRKLALQNLSPTMAVKNDDDAIDKTAHHGKEEISEDAKRGIRDHFGTLESPMDDEAMEAILDQVGEKTTEVPNIDTYGKEIFGSIDQLVEHEDNIAELVEDTKEVIIEDISLHADEELVLEPTQEMIQHQVTVEQENFADKTKEQTLEEVVQENQFEEPKQTEPQEEVEKEIPCDKYKLPKIDILKTEMKAQDIDTMMNESKQKSTIIDNLFENFKIGAKVVNFEIGPTVTTYEVQVEPGTKLTRITNLEDDIKMTLSAKSIRIQAPIPGKSLVGIEVPNDTKKLVSFKEVYNQTSEQDFQNKILISMGQDVFGKPITFDLAATPHMLVAGSTGSGKSVAINTVLASIVLRYKPEDVKMVLIDPKMVEFAPFHGLPHLITPVVTNAADANLALKAIVMEMEERYKMMAGSGARNLAELNKKRIARGDEKLPFIVVIVDELADLMMVAAKEVEDSIMRITQKARAAGIHMIVATQRPSTDVITGVIKSNIPSRIAFTVASSIDSRTILDRTGAEKLVGKGDMLMSLYGQLPFRGQGAYISSEEVETLTDYAKTQCTPKYTIEISKAATAGLVGSAMSEDDPLYQAALEVVTMQGKASTSLIQRYLKVGYNKAANIIDALEANGVIGPARGSKPREVLINNDQES